MRCLDQLSAAVAAATVTVEDTVAGRGWNAFDAASVRVNLEETTKAGGGGTDDDRRSPVDRCSQVCLILSLSKSDVMSMMMNWRLSPLRRRFLIEIKCTLGWRRILLQQTTRTHFSFDDVGGQGEQTPERRKGSQL